MPEDEDIDMMAGVKNDVVGLRQNKRTFFFSEPALMNLFPTESHQGDLYPRRGSQGSLVLRFGRRHSVLGNLYQHLLSCLGNQQPSARWLWLFAVGRHRLAPLALD